MLEKREFYFIQKKNSEHGLSFLTTPDRQLAGACVLRTVGVSLPPGRPPGWPPGQFSGCLKHNHASKNKELCFVRRSNSEVADFCDIFAKPQLPEPNFVITTSCATLLGCQQNFYQKYAEKATIKIVESPDERQKHNNLLIRRLIGPSF